MSLVHLDAPALMRDQDFQAPLARTAGAGTAGLEEITDIERSDRLARMREGSLGSIHSWELVTAVDGPGTRMTVFVSGCPLQCVYCHNPDTLMMKNGQPIATDELLARMKRYRRIFKATNGGITLSGGEILMQPAFAFNILKGAKEMGIHTAIDTSGYLGAAVSDEMLEQIDLVLLDVKSGIPEIYREVTGGRELQPTIDFGDRLSAHGTEIWVRFVLIPGLTDSPENIDAIAKIVTRWKTVTRLEVLPFHQMGMDKWEALGEEYPLKDTKPPTVESVNETRERFRSYGLTVF